MGGTHASHSLRATLGTSRHFPLTTHSLQRHYTQRTRSGDTEEKMEDHDYDHDGSFYCCRLQTKRLHQLGNKLDPGVPAQPEETSLSNTGIQLSHQKQSIGVKTMPWVESTWEGHSTKQPARLLLKCMAGKRKKLRHDSRLKGD